MMGCLYLLVLDWGRRSSEVKYICFDTKSVTDNQVEYISSSALLLTLHKNIFSRISHLSWKHRDIGILFGLQSFVFK